VTVITCTPNPTSVPAAGDWLKVMPLVPLQLSLALTPPKTSGTTASQFVPALTLVGAGQVTVGAVSSLTVKVVVQVALLVAASVARTHAAQNTRHHRQAVRAGAAAGWRRASHRRGCIVTHREPRAALFPFTTLFRSRHRDHVHAQSDQRPRCRRLAQSDAVGP